MEVNAEKNERMLLPISQNPRTIVKFRNSGVTDQSVAFQEGPSIALQN